MPLSARLTALLGHADETLIEHIRSLQSGT